MGHGLDMDSGWLYHSVLSMSPKRCVHRRKLGFVQVPRLVNPTASNRAQRRWLLQVGPIAILVCVGCASSFESREKATTKPAKLGATHNFWPLFYREIVPEEGSREEPAAEGYKINTHVLYPLIHNETHRDRSVFMLKPLLNVERSHETSFRQWQVLWPFFLWRQRPKPERREFWFMPLISWRSEPSTKGKAESDFLLAALLPIVVASDKDADGQGTFVLGPLFGKGCKILADERIDFVLFPLYMRRQRLGDTRHDFLWPFFSVTKGKRRGFRIWPLFVKKEYPGRYVKNWALWPFVHWGKLNLHHRHPITQWGIFPLYRQSESDVAYEYRILSIVARVRKNKISGQSEAEYIWPISLLSKKPKAPKDTKGFWPFFIHTKRDKLTRVAALYGPRRSGVATMPFIWYEDNREVPDHRRKSFSFFPIWFDTKYYWKEGPMSGYQRLFPLYGYERVIGGDKRLGILSLPHFHDMLAQGFERNYSILGLYQYRRWADGLRTHRFFGALYRYDKGRGLLDVDLPPLFRYRRDDPQTYYYQYLFGLVKHGREANRKTLRLFYMPFGGLPAYVPLRRSKAEESPAE